MRTLVVVLVSAGYSFTAATAFGQQHGGPAGPAGQPNIIHPGVPSFGPPRVHPHFGGGFGGGAGFFPGQAGYIPYVIPFDLGFGGYGGGYGGAGYGGGFGYGYPGGYAPQPGYYDPIFGSYNPGPYPQQPQQQTPTVVINQSFQPDTVHPVLRDYSNLQPPNVTQLGGPPQDAPQQVPPGTTLADDQPTIFLIAMKDHTIYPAIAYWVDKDTLNYVTVEGGVKRVPYDQVDRDLSKQLNDQRSVEFRLPAR